MTDQTAVDPDVEDPVPDPEPVDDPQPVQEAGDEEPTTTVAERDPAAHSTSVAVVSSEAAELIRTTLNPDLTDGELMLFAAVCNRVGLDPFARQIYAVKRNDRHAPGGKKMTIQTGIDGFRLIARRTGKMAGRIGPYFCGDDGEWKIQRLPDGSDGPAPWLSTDPPAAALCGVVRHGDLVPTYGVAKWVEYKPASPQDTMWIKMPTTMLGKCAEAQAIRAAFPAETSGLYIEEEMMQADRPSTIVDPPEEPLWSEADPDGFAEIRERIARIKATSEGGIGALIAMWTEKDDDGRPRLAPIGRLLRREAVKAGALVASIEARIKKSDFGDADRAAWTNWSPADAANEDGDAPESGGETPVGADAPETTPAEEAAPGAVQEPEERKSSFDDATLMQEVVNFVKPMALSDVMRALEARGLDVDGGPDTKRKRLSLALYLERGGTPPREHSIPTQPHEQVEETGDGALPLS